MLYENIITVIKDALKFHRYLLAFFIVASITGLVLGVMWPKFYTSSATIFIQEENILGPLMRGAAVQTDVVDRAKIARDIVYGRDFLIRVLKSQGIIDDKTTSAEAEALTEKLKANLRITNASKNLIKFSFKSTDPQLAYSTLTKILDLFISESLSTKLQESQSAYEFIDKQVREYHEKLKQAEEKLKEFRSKNVDIRAGSTQEITTRIQAIQTKIADISQQLREAKIKKQTLLSQLAGEAATAAGLSKAEEYRARIIDLQNKLDTLLLTYHETYPDVVRTKTQIDELKNALRQEELDKQSGKSGNTITIEGVVVDERIQASPVYQQLRTDLYATNSTIKTLSSRLEDAKNTLAEQEDLARRTHELSATLVELERDYTVNSDIYQDFLRRREAARVSMNVDLEQKGLNLRIDEPPFLPSTTSGLGKLHFLGGGLLLGILLPIGILYGILQIDPRIRNSGQIAEFTDVPIIGNVNTYYSAAEIESTKKNYLITVGIGMLSAIAVIIVAFKV